MSLLEEALGNPNQIAETYPSIDLAVKLISGQDTGNISLAGVREMVEEARWPVCLTSPSYVCVVAEALAAAEMVKDDFSRARVLAYIARAQGEVGDIQGAKESITEALAAVEEVEEDKEKKRERRQEKRKSKGRKEHRRNGG